MAMEKSNHELKVEFMRLCVCDRKKITALKLLLSFLGHITNVNLLSRKISKMTSNQHNFFLYFRDRPKSGEGNKRDVESIYVQE